MIPFPAQWPTTAIGLVALLIVVIAAMWLNAVSRQGKVDQKLSKIDTASEPLAAAVENLSREFSSMRVSLESKVTAVATDVHELRKEFDAQRRRNHDRDLEVRSEMENLESAFRRRQNGSGNREAG